MTDTTPEAVERLARVLDGPFYRVEGYAGPYIDEATLRDEHTAAAATLRAQQADIARLTADRDAWSAENAENLRQLVAAIAERDAALAQVAGAYEAAALFCDETAAEALDESGEASRILNVWFKGQARAIRALTPADATAALDRIKRQARADGMRKAAETAPPVDNKISADPVGKEG